VSAIYILDKITEYCMRSRRSSKKELAEALAAIAVILSFEFAAPAIALAVGTMGIGDIIAAATFAVGFGAGVAFWGGWVGNCLYTGYLAFTHGWAALNNPSPWLCGAVTAGVL
jgi:hypothetical protein